MEAYEGFAQVYDRFMNNVDYDQWVEYIEKIFEKFNIKPNLMAELGCGTGNITNRLSKKGYDMIGIDISQDMLSIAREKAYDEELNILYLCQNMCKFELFGTVDVVLSICDSLNYITKDKDMEKVFKLVNNYLEPKGLFIFDLNTEYKFKNILAENVFGETDEDCAFIWQNSYNEDDKINQYYVNFFVEEENGKYERIEECHHERAYTIEEIKNFIEKSGMDFVAVYDAFTFNEPTEKSERIYVIARENGK
ncbi:MAG: class I SAM-dependent DNA methyltransferase [Anaerotignaceae bacterium]